MFVRCWERVLLVVVSMEEEVDVDVDAGSAIDDNEVDVGVHCEED
jgi:hypothetical protein